MRASYTFKVRPDPAQRTARDQMRCKKTEHGSSASWCPKRLCKGDCAALKSSFTELGHQLCSDPNVLRDALLLLLLPRGRKHAAAMGANQIPPRAW
jgi:hypothetical protein